MLDTNSLGSHPYLNRCKNYLKKPQNAILVVLGIFLSIATIFPMVTIWLDTVSIHAGSVDAQFSGRQSGYTLYNWIDILCGRLAKRNFWIPLQNTILLSALSCFIAICFGGIFAYLITRTNMKAKKYLSNIFIFPYVMPQWTLAVVWQNMFYSKAVTGGSDGLLTALTGIQMPLWWCQGLFPTALVLGTHYAAFAYILIGGIFQNMDANLEEAATILNTPKHRIFMCITLPMVQPAILSTILLVFSSAMGSYPVPHYLNFTTLATKYVDLNVNRAGQASALAVIMMLFGIAILIVNQCATGGRKSFTTVTGKSGQASKFNLGIGKYIIPVFLVILTFFTSIFPVISFALETFLPNPGDYSFFKTWNPANLTTKWWLSSSGSAGSMFGQKGILYNTTIWHAFFGTILVAISCAFLAGTIGLLVGYCVSKNRKSKFAAYVNSVAFLPYLLPSLAVGVAFFIFGSRVGLYNTYILLILAGTIKYIPFASRASLNSMLQISGEIEESAIIHNIPWTQRMWRIIIPIQKSAILSGYLLPLMTCIRELTLFMMLCAQTKLLTLLLDYFDEMGLYAFSSGINLMLIIFVIACNFAVNKLTGASLDKGIGGN